jgi:hypothetical protein
MILFCHNRFKTKFKDKSDFFIYEELSKSGANEVRNKVEEGGKTRYDFTTGYFWN